jgi:hypothetical protein
MRGNLDLQAFRQDWQQSINRIFLKPVSRGTYLERR